MTNKLQDALRVAAVVCGVAIASGCASVTPEMIDEVRATADEALNAAQQAQQTANQAQQTAQSAQSTANQALTAAQDAQACCDATNQRVDRMFEQSVSK